PCSSKIVHARGEGGRTNAVIQSHASDLSFRRPAAVAAFAEQFANVGQIWRLPNTPGNERRVVTSAQVGEAVAKRAPDIDAIAGPQGGELAGQSTDNEVNDVEANRCSVTFQHRVVKCERTAEQRVADIRQSEHDELAGPNRRGDF